MGSRVKDPSGRVIVLGRVQLLLGRVNGRVQGVRVHKVPVIISSSAPYSCPSRFPTNKGSRVGVC